MVDDRPLNPTQCPGDGWPRVLPAPPPRAASAPWTVHSRCCRRHHLPTRSEGAGRPAARMRGRRPARAAQSRGRFPCPASSGETQVRCHARKTVRQRRQARLRANSYSAHTATLRPPQGHMHSAWETGPWIKRGFGSGKAFGSRGALDEEGLWIRWAFGSGGPLDQEGLWVRWACRSRGALGQVKPLDQEGLWVRKGFGSGGHLGQVGLWIRIRAFLPNRTQEDTAARRGHIEDWVGHPCTHTDEATLRSG
eukprot:366498-Chlamydomonas_euryale.AAC.10